MPYYSANRMASRSPGWRPHRASSTTRRSKSIVIDSWTKEEGYPDRSSSEAPGDPQYDAEESNPLAAGSLSLFRLPFLTVAASSHQ